MSDFLLRVRPDADGFTATLSELAARHRDELATVGTPAQGRASTVNGAVLAAVIAARIPAIPASRLLRYAD